MNDTTGTIRPYLAEDMEAVIGVWQRANALAHPFLSEDFVAEVHQAMRDVYLPNAETYVLERGGNVVGFIALIGNEIGGLFLDPALHGQGHGRALVDHAVSLKGPLSVEVFRDNEIGRPFYERYGFEFVADELHAPSGHVSRKMAMPARNLTNTLPVPESGGGQANLRRAIAGGSVVSGACRAASRDRSMRTPSFDTGQAGFAGGCCLPAFCCERQRQIHPRPNPHWRPTGLSRSQRPGSYQENFSTWVSELRSRN